MRFAALTTVAILAGTAAAKTCRNFTVPVTISSRNGVFGNMVTPLTNLDATTFIQNETRQGGNFTAQALTGYATISGTYNISAQYCTPSGTNATLKTPTVQVLTHGIGFDKTYWDLSYNNFNYSYVDVATDKYGYSTLAYDRLGIGNSSHGEPKDEIQSFLEIQALRALTLKLRNGTIPTVNQTFSKVVHVGHSFGSAQTYSLINLYPNISDGAVLTGFSMNASFVGYFAAGGNFLQAQYNQPFRFGNMTIGSVLQQVSQNYGLVDLFAPASMVPQSLNYPLGYLTHSNTGALQYLFLFPGHFDQQLAFIGEQTKQPVTVGEVLTLTSLPMTNSFRGPVMVISGSNDLPYCGGDCLNTGGSGASIPAAVQKNFPNTNITTYIQPVTGHGINFHYNATGAYNVINTFLDSRGLASH